MIDGHIYILCCYMLVTMYPLESIYFYCLMWFISVTPHIQNSKFPFVFSLKVKGSWQCFLFFWSLLSKSQLSVSLQKQAKFKAVHYSVGALIYYFLSSFASLMTVNKHVFKHTMWNLRYENLILLFCTTHINEIYPINYLQEYNKTGNFQHCIMREKIQRNFCSLFLFTAYFRKEIYWLSWLLSTCLHSSYGFIMLWCDWLASVLEKTSTFHTAMWSKIINTGKPPFNDSLIQQAGWAPEPLAVVTWNEEWQNFSFITLYNSLEMLQWWQLSISDYKGCGQIYILCSYYFLQDQTF